MIQPIFWKTVVIFSLILEIVTENHEHHGSLHHRNGWPIRHGVQSHSRHNHEGQWGRLHEAANRESFQETRNPMSQEVIGRDFKDTERLEQNTRHHVGHRLFDGVDQRPIRTDKLSAVSVNDYSGIQTLGFSGFHNNYPQRETSPPVFVRVTTTPSPYTKHHAGRRVCTRTAPTSVSHHHRGRQIRLVYTEYTSGFLCCPGWTQVTRLSFGCNKPTCSVPCQNGGVCTSPGTCTCPKGFTGSQCQTDIDECITEKPCAQLCRNLPGKYECYCRYGFQLQPDGQSCRKNDSDGTAFEAHDLENNFGIETTSSTNRDTENEVGDDNEDRDYEVILKRLTKLEKQFARGKKREIESIDMNLKLSSAVESINEMKRTVENVQLMQQEIYEMRGKLKQFEFETRRIQHLTNRVIDLENRLRIRCRS
ncbi:uncharacterized protein LOC117182189 [Belonocnema kinseyi]|uniref:uncharacterized protein LOC117182189 n=1 Tax=Belonocnema kinseyi TaxID=2817044 RepID=UPI00143DC7F1|nr:uncharacterized protein LOC117182189 [Belonocnema kinseyi]